MSPVKKRSARRAGTGSRAGKAAQGMATRAVHAGEPRNADSGSLTVPIYQSATFSSRTTREMIAISQGRQEGNFYTRYGNTTTRAVERKLAALDEAGDALLFSSGMAAITTSLLAMLRAGDHVVSSDAIYGNAQSFLLEVLPRFGVEVSFGDPSDPDRFMALARANTRLVYAESPVNPTLRVLDLLRLGRMAARRKLPFLVDATFSSPVNQQSLKFGATLAIHSATKYLGGHADLIAGAVCGSRPLIARIRNMRKTLGCVADPHQAWLLARGMRTLTVRVRRQNEVGMEVARWLERRPGVLSVLYPGLKSHPQHVLAKKQLKGYGGMVTFEVRGGVKGASRVADRLKLVRLAPSLGGVESIVSQPPLTSHLYVSAEARRRAGIRDGMLRLSCGIEDPADLIADLDQALRGRK